MDVLKLDSNFDPSELVQNYETIAWTERYYTAGEFELSTYLVDETIALLPIDSCVSLSVTKQVMVVEEHLIESNESGIDILKVSGRSIDGLMDTRYLLNGYYSLMPGVQPQPRQTASLNSEEAIRYILNGIYLTSDDYMSPGFDDDNNEFTPVVAFASPEVVDYGDEFVRYLKAGPLDKIIREILAEIDGGLKSDRTITSGVAAGEVALYIYKGRDLTESESTPNYVTFSVDNGDFNSVSYLRSVRNYKNVAYYLAGLDPPTHAESGHKSISLPETIPATVSGLSRREMYVNTVDFYRDEDFAGDPQEVSLEIAKMELRKNQRTIFVTAEISDVLKDQYNVTYALGDLVTFRGKYGITADMQITEFTRIQDKNGERAYPTLTEQPTI